MEAGHGCGAAQAAAGNALGGAALPELWAQRGCCDAILPFLVPLLPVLVFSGEFLRASDLTLFTGAKGNNGTCLIDFSGLNTITL